jgi:hypothetical protein
LRESGEDFLPMPASYFSQVKKNKGYRRFAKKRDEEKDLGCQCPGEEFYFTID